MIQAQKKQDEEERKLIAEVFGEEMSQKIDELVQSMIQNRYPAEHLYDDIEELESDKLIQDEGYYWGE